MALANGRNCKKENIVLGGENIKAYKIRCYPTDEQKHLIIKTFGCCRWYWNQALHDNVKYYEEYQKGKINTPAFYKKEFEWLKEVDSMAL